MGFFSWKTADSKESIANMHAVHPNSARTVYMLQPNGKEPIIERFYEGYGVFGGVDAYAWLARMNIDTPEVQQLFQRGDVEKLRLIGIEFAFSEEGRKCQYPLKFSFDFNAYYECLPASEMCDNQGFFYDEDELEGEYGLSSL